MFVQTERTKLIGTRVEPEVYDRLTAAARAHDLRLAQVLRRLVYEHVGEPSNATTAVSAAAVSEDPPIRAERRVEL